jgi:hypothetical protein
MAMRLLASLLAAAAVAAVASQVAAGDGGPAPGAMIGWDGVAAPGGHLRYVALPGGPRVTTVVAVRTRDGRIVRFGVVRGTFGVPQVAFDGTTDGLSGDRQRLVLTSAMGGPAPARTTFVVLRTSNLRAQRTIPLGGLWAFDAISPDGSTIYALQYGPGDRYAVRAIDATSGRVFPGAVVDPREPDEAMQGTPVTRAWSRDRGWAYTLYARPNGTAFVHGLDTKHRAAVCLDLPWRAAGNAIWRVKLQVLGGGRVLALGDASRGTLATVDLATRAVRSVRPLHAT